MDGRKACGMKIVWDIVGKQINICLPCVHEKIINGISLDQEGQTDTVRDFASRIRPIWLTEEQTEYQ